MHRRPAYHRAFRFALLAVLLVGGLALSFRNEHTLATRAQSTDESVFHGGAGTNTEIWRIDRPNVKRSITPYRQIIFKPGDRITIQADGCVQTGGTGDTWKRYVNPSGSNTDKYYHGKIQIPGATAGLVAFIKITQPVSSPNQTWKATLSIPWNFVSPDPIFLKLGYDDDDYTDNGYYSHDDGNDDQCKNTGVTNGGPAWVSLTIEHGAGPGNQSCTAPYDLDLASAEFDLNGLPLNPRWCSQSNQQKPWPVLPSQTGSGPGVCDTPWKAPCTTQSPTIVELPEWYDPDPYDQGAKWCALSGPLGRHVNWGLVSYEGKAAWESVSDIHDVNIYPPGLPDDDYNINISRGDLAAYTQQNPDNVHTEFDSDETIDHFNTPWWKAFHESVSSGNIKAGDSIGTEVIEIGEIGLDCAHSCGSEIHPVLVLAVHVQESLSDDTWAIFARNTGNEGFCGHVSIVHDELSTLFLSLPWPDGAAASPPVVKDTTTWEKTAVGGADRIGLTTFPFQIRPNKQVFVLQIDLGAADAAPLVDGELHLQWTPKSGAGQYRTPSSRLGGLRGTFPTSPVRRRSADSPEPEETFAKMVAGLPSNSRQRIAQLLKTKSAGPRWAPLRPTNLRQPPANFALKTRVSGRPALHKGRVVPPNQSKKELYTNLGKILKQANARFPHR